ncbi:MAG: hypothetical protein Kow0059_22670 [Candidatus Sumerlaeia bacterium]
MKVSLQEEYGVRVLLQLARAYQTGAGGMTIQEIAEAEGLSVQVVGRIMVVLKDSGLASESKGARREFTLSRPPRAITLDETLTVLGGRLFDSAYCEEHSGGAEVFCVHTCGCTLRPVWGHIELIVSSVLRRISLADLLEDEAVIRSNLPRLVQ